MSWIECADVGRSWLGSFRAVALLALICCLVSGVALPGDLAEPQTEPKLHPLPKQIPAAKDHPSSPEKVQLGKQLFFDPRLSGNNRMSCATCHMPDKAFADGLPQSKGADGKLLARNTPTVLNSAFLSNFLWDGRAASLEQQALGPIESAEEMDQDLDELVKELAAVDGYARQFRKVFGKPPDPSSIAQALAAFQRTLVTRNSALDQFLAGDKSALSPLARRGMALFSGEAGCIRCHHGPMLSDGKFYRLGVSQQDVSQRDRGRNVVTGKRDDLYKFRTPPLRDIAHTAPYMHDGSQKTLADVVEFYFRGVADRGPEGLDLDVKPLSDLSFSDIDALVAFLKSLSGELPEVTPPELP